MSSAYRIIWEWEREIFILERASSRFIQHHLGSIWLEHNGISFISTNVFPIPEQNEATALKEIARSNNPSSTNEISFTIVEVEAPIAKMALTTHRVFTRNQILRFDRLAQNRNWHRRSFPTIGHTFVTGDAVDLFIIDITEWLGWWKTIDVFRCGRENADGFETLSADGLNEASWTWRWNDLLLGSEYHSYDSNHRLDLEREKIVPLHPQWEEQLWMCRIFSAAWSNFPMVSCRFSVHWSF